MNNSAIFKSAHKLTKKIIKAGDNYRVTFGACVRFVLEKLSSGEVSAQTDSITLSSGTLVTRTAERDMDGYYYIKLEKEGVTTLNFKLPKFKVKEITEEDVRYSSKLKEKIIGKCELDGYNMNGDKPVMLSIFINTEDAEKVKDFILKRKLHKFKTYSEFDAFCQTDQYKNGFFGDDFASLGCDDYRVAVYEYAEAYKKTNYDLAQDAKKAKIEAERKAEADKAAEQAELLGLPKLKGTEKQVIWAEQLRSKYFAKTSEKNLAPRCKSVKTAKWWIEKRFDLGIEQKKQRNEWGI